MKELLKYYHEKRIVTLGEVNDQIQTFPYAPSDILNRPTLIPFTTFNSKDHSLKQKGMYMYMYNYVFVIRMFLYVNSMITS